MTNDIAIRVENLGKRYRLGATIDLKRNFRETLATLPKFFGRKIAKLPAGLEARGRQSAESATSDPDTPPGTFWALRNLNFEIKQGSVVGVIGRNGAGKSTLLKILSRITAPTVGYAEYRGRISSLLEVGTGFHPELTGRENIFLNGSILGMRKAEIVRKFDEIVQFAEVDKFLDTPVKRYSSGMRVRLAFSVAAFLEPEIMIIDEVLAVGDAEFQQKCLGRMDSVAHEGRTVLFVSHNMQAVKSLCHRAIVLEQGSVALDADTETAVEYYLASGSQYNINHEITPEMHLIENPELEVHRLEIINPSGESVDKILMEEPFKIRMHYRIHDPAKSYRIGFVLHALDSTRIATSVSTNGGHSHLKGEKEKNYYIDADVHNPLLPGKYYFDVITKTSTSDLVDSINGIQFEVLPISAGEGRYGAGIIWLDAKWSNQIRNQP